MNPLVSVIVPIYNLEKDISKCIDSIRKQTYNNLQILIINDGSEDMSASICEQLTIWDERILIVNKKNFGVSHARNCGIQCSFGEYIMFIDGDDTVSETWIELYVKSAVDTKADVIFGGLTKIKEDNSEEKMTIENGVLSNLEMWHMLCDVNQGFWIYGFVPNKMTKSNLLLKHNICFDEEMIVQEDIDITIKILKYANVIDRIDNCGYYYKPSNYSRRQYLDLIKNQVNLLISASIFISLTEKEIKQFQSIIKRLIVTDLKQYKQRQSFCDECTNLSKLLNQEDFINYRRGLIMFLISNNKMNLLYIIIGMIKVPHCVKEILCNLNQKYMEN